MCIRDRTYGDPFAGPEKGEEYVVVPRAGTISPWSSKATDIVHNCGLEDVRPVSYTHLDERIAGPFSLCGFVETETFATLTRAVTFPDQFHVFVGSGRDGTAVFGNTVPRCV